MKYYSLALLTWNARAVDQQDPLMSDLTHFEFEEGRSSRQTQGNANG